MLAPLGLPVMIPRWVSGLELSHLDLIVLPCVRYEIEHPAVVGSGVAGKADAARGGIVVAFVVLHRDYAGSPELVRELQDYTRNRLSAHACPRDVVFVDELPKTPSGKIRRHVLREQLSQRWGWRFITPRDR